MTKTEKKETNDKKNKIRLLIINLFSSCLTSLKNSRLKIRQIMRTKYRMTLDNHVNYVGTYFEYKTLTKIHGEPTFESIKKIKDELKANAMAVNSELGGGRHGHSGLVLAAEEYRRISNTPYRRPQDPGELNIPENTTQHEATRLRNEHKEAIKLLRETIDLEKL